MVRSTRGKWLFPELNHSVTSGTYRLHVSPRFPFSCTASGTAPIFRSQRTVFTLFRGWKHEVGTSGTKAFSTFQGRLWSNPSRFQFNFQSRLRGFVRKVQAIFDSREILQKYPIEKSLFRSDLFPTFWFVICTYVENLANFAECYLFGSFWAEITL